MKKLETLNTAKFAKVEIKKDKMNQLLGASKHMSGETLNYDTNFGKSLDYIKDINPPS